ncbi:collagen alpha-1(XXIV) chain-like [Triplophysa rosa]|uniref:collagen alpha-1(XXIV) chain-like n=1 Tax=Triplophysa rosa TaxID=992332 RepID=UPI002545DE78|nr:collagen alpha-1(XXIV) chain-like [Triplophysa rosa]
MHLGAQRTRSGRVSPTDTTRFFVLLLSTCAALLSAEECSSAQGVDVIRHLGLSGHRDTQTSGTDYLTSLASSPTVLPPGVGVTLGRESLIDFPSPGLFPAGVDEEFSLVVTLRSWRASNAFLFSVRDNKDRLEFGLQLLGGRVVVHMGEKASVYFKHELQDGQWHSFSVGVRRRSVSFFARCGAVRRSEETLTRTQTLGSEGRVSVGKMDPRAVQFEGALCQLDIYPCAQAAAQYCDYVKKQCRLSDTFRSETSPASPHASSGSRLSTFTPSPRLNRFSQTLRSLTTRHPGPSPSPLSGFPSFTAEIPITEKTPEHQQALMKPRGTEVTPYPVTVVRKRRLRNNVKENAVKVNGTVLYREESSYNVLDTSEEGMHETGYSDGYGYDYGFDEDEYFFEYDGFIGPKGDPGPPGLPGPPVIEQKIVGSIP